MITFSIQGRRNVYRYVEINTARHEHIVYCHIYSYRSFVGQLIHGIMHKKPAFTCTLENFALWIKAINLGVLHFSCNCSVLWMKNHRRWHIFQIFSLNLFSSLITVCIYKVISISKEQLLNTFWIKIQSFITYSNCPSLFLKLH